MVSLSIIKKLAYIGILRIADLISEDNKLITNKLRELNVSPLDAFRLTCVIEALPIEWRIFLKTCHYSVIERFNLQNQVQLSLNGPNVLLSNAVSKIIYKEIRNRNITPPTAQLKYNAQFPSDELDWKKYTAYHNVLPWIQNRRNFNINFSIGVLPRMFSLAKLG